jgi:hypothetical protein
VTVCRAGQEERVHQVGHYPELHQDARSTKHKKHKGTYVLVRKRKYLNMCIWVQERLVSFNT